MRLTVLPAAGPLRGEARVPGDKSIAHRWLILASTAEGHSEIAGLPYSLDVRSTARCLAGLLPEARLALNAFTRGVADPGVYGQVVQIEGLGFDSPRAPGEPLYCGNSGTTMRLLTGLLAGQAFEATLDGDESLHRRPMERVAQPLRMMGADVRTGDGHAPVTVHGGSLIGIEYATPLPSAQVKGAVLLAGLQADGETTVIEATDTRDHTERCLLALGAPVVLEPGRVTVRRYQHAGFIAALPGDPSSAAFLAAAAAVVSGSQIAVRDVGLNSTRMGWIRHLVAMGARVAGIVEGERLGEPAGTLDVEGTGALRPVHLTPEETAESIDEIPMLAMVAVHADGESRFHGAGELRVKESDRLTGVVDGITGLGGEARVEGDDLIVSGGGLRGGTAEGRSDHRLVMAFAVGALGADAACAIDGAEWAGVSFPGFTEVMWSLGAEMREEDGT